MSRNTKLGLLIVGLIVALGASHYLFGNTEGDIYNAEHPWEVKKNAKAPPGKYTHIPAPSGPTNAPVKVDVYMKGGDDCHAPTIDMVLSVEKQHPGKLRTVFHDTRDLKTAQRIKALKGGCQVSLFVNGQRTFRMPGRGKYGFVTLDGPPGHAGYGPADFEAVVVMMLKKKGIDAAAVRESATPQTQNATGSPAGAG